jgi:triosephosphate isomerase (TIM)
MRGKLVVGNWKMNGGLKRNDALLADLRGGWTAPEGRALAVCVPYPYLWQAQAALSGDVSAAMVAEFGCTYAIVGHSERRSLHGESDALVAEKAAAAMAAGLKPIVCVGETLAQRDSGETEAVVLRQLDAAVARLGAKLASAIVAYEPVWAIGTGRTATPEQAQAVHRLLRQRLQAAGPDARNLLLLYGGSVKADNARALFACPDVDGGLVGGASLNAAEFLTIAHA